MTAGDSWLQCAVPDHVWALFIQTPLWAISERAIAAAVMTRHVAGLYSIAYWRHSS